MSDPVNSEIIITWEAHARPGVEAELEAFLTDITTTALDGGVVDAYEVEAEPGAFVICERWTSRKALDRHLRNPRTQMLMSQLAALKES